MRKQKVYSQKPEDTAIHGQRDIMKVNPNLFRVEVTFLVCRPQRNFATRGGICRGSLATIVKVVPRRDCDEHSAHTVVLN